MAQLQTKQEPSCLDKMRAYIEKTPKPATSYDIRVGELDALWHMAASERDKALLLAFEYGQARATRAAKQRRRRHHE